MPPLILTGTTGSSQHFSRRTKSSAACTIAPLPRRSFADHGMPLGSGQHHIIAGCGFAVGFRAPAHNGHLGTKALLHSLDEDMKWTPRFQIFEGPAPRARSDPRLRHRRRVDPRLRLADRGVLEGDTAAFDRVVAAAMRGDGGSHDPIGPPWLEEFARDITALGSFAFLGILTFGVIGYFLLTQRRALAALVAAAVLGGRRAQQSAEAQFSTATDRSCPAACGSSPPASPSGHAHPLGDIVSDPRRLAGADQPRSAGEGLLRHPGDHPHRPRSAPAGSISASTSPATCWPAGASAVPGPCSAGWSPLTCDGVKPRRRPRPSGSARRSQRVRDDREMAGRNFDRLGLHALCHEALQVGD